MQARSAGTKRRSPDRDETAGTSPTAEASACATNALFSRLTLAEPVAAPSGVAGCEGLAPASARAPVTEEAEVSDAKEAEVSPRSPAATRSRRPAHEQRSQGAAGDSGGGEAGAASPDGASWRLPLAAADAPFTAQEVQPLGRSAEGLAEAEPPATALVAASRPRAQGERLSFSCHNHGG